ncbi:MAG: hypothetical protein ACK2UR_00455 [Candidatus Promineifilaceae bacterium]
MNTLKYLQSLSADPEQQAASAVELIQPGERHDVLLAAMIVLAENPSEEAHDPLIRIYDYLAANGVRRDAGAHVRSAVLNALRPVARLEDLPLLLRAVETYEYLPPGFKEEAGALRAAALLALNELEDETTDFHAVRLLVDQHTAQMSGEPAVTAVRVLSSRGELAALFEYVMQPDESISAEVSSECLRNLTSLPTSLLPGLVTYLNRRANEVEQLGLFEMLINHESGPQQLHYIESYLSDPDDLDVYRFVVITALSSHQPELLQLVCDVAEAEGDERRQRALKEAMQPFTHHDRIAEIVQNLSLS